MSLDFGTITDLSQALIDVEAVPNFDAFKKPGQMKQVFGIDLAVQGETTVSLLYNEGDASLESESFQFEGDSRPNGMIGLDAAGTAFALRFRHAADEMWELDLATFYYDVLGAM